jgi:hypothetical protein
MIRAVLAALAALAAVVVAACGVSLEDRPQRSDDTSIQPGRPPRVETTRPTTSPSPTTTTTTTGPPSSTPDR